MAKFNVGDKVVIARKGETWNLEGGMDKWLGKEMTIREVWGSETYQMVEDADENNGGWAGDEEDLAPIDTTITVMRYGDMITATDGKETVTVEVGSNYKYTMHAAIDKLFEKVEKAKEIHVGDFVKVVDDGGMYTTYTEWVVKNVDDKEKAVRYAYDSETVPSKCKVVVIGKHDDEETTLAYIEDVEWPYHCYLINVDGLKKV